MTRTAFVCLLITGILCFTAGNSEGYPTVDQLDQYRKKVEYHQNDIVGIGDNLGCEYKSTVGILLMMTSECVPKLIHLQDLVKIHSGLKSSVNQVSIDSMIKKRNDELSSYMMNSIEFINKMLSSIENKALVFTVIQLRTDFRNLQEILEDSPSK